MFTVNNVKVHVRVAGGVIVPTDFEDDKLTQYSNFVVCRLANFVYTVFPKKGHVNISGIRNFAQIPSAVTVFNSRFHTNIIPINVVVDNSTASGKLSKPVQLHSLLAHRHPDITISIRPHYFPSAVIRSLSSSSLPKSRTIILFANGKYNIVGAKSEQEIRQTVETLCAITRK